MTYIKSNIIFLRAKSCLTQRGAAAGIGVLLETYQAWLRGIDPKTNHLKAISEYYKVSIDFLVRRDLSRVSDNVINLNYLQIQEYLKAA